MLSLQDFVKTIATRSVSFQYLKPSVQSNLRAARELEAHSPWSESERSEQRVEPTLSMRILSPSPKLLWTAAPLPPLSSSS